MSILKTVWLAVGVGLLLTFIALSFWGIPAPLAVIEKQVSPERLAPVEGRSGQARGGIIAQILSNGS